MNRQLITDEETIKKGIEMGIIEGRKEREDEIIEIIKELKWDLKTDITKEQIDYLIKQIKEKEQ